MKVEHTMIKMVTHHSSGEDAWIIQDCSGELGLEIATSPAELISSILFGAGMDVNITQCEAFIAEIRRER